MKAALVGFLVVVVAAVIGFAVLPVPEDLDFGDVVTLSLVLGAALGALGSGPIWIWVERRLQARALAEVRRERDALLAAFNEWMRKTDWVQREFEALGGTVGEHRADIMRNAIRRLTYALAEKGGASC